MYKILAYSTFSWLVLSGVLHFTIDVVSQYVVVFEHRDLRPHFITDFTRVMPLA